MSKAPRVVLHFAVESLTQFTGVGKRTTHQKRNRTGYFSTTPDNLINPDG